MAEALNEEAVEAAAQELWEQNGSPPGGCSFDMIWKSGAKYSDALEDLARTAIAAYLSAMAERGERMMPREASAEMYKRGQAEIATSEMWTAMWDAHAPTATKEG